MSIKITNRFNTSIVVKEIEAETLVSADLTYANLRSADLRSADLRYADLTYANLRSADLTYADLTYADLRSANLTYADLTYADLTYADLTYADLAGAKINWQSHDLIAEILRRSAGEDFAKRQLAGGILVSRDWCWNEWMALAKDHPLADWALDTLAAWVVEGDDAPKVLRDRVPAVTVVAEEKEGN